MADVGGAGGAVGGPAVRPTRPIFVAMKYVSLRPEIDPLTGSIAAADERFSGSSAADQAALEWALRITGQTTADVVVATVSSSGGPSAGADAMLRDAVACGAKRAIRLSNDGDLSSYAVARGLAALAQDLGAGLVLCGDWSLDRGSGSVPPFLAAARDVPFACGLVTLALVGSTELAVERRLDGGRRERLRVALDGDAVLSVEGATARLRRASLAGVVAARSAQIEVVAMGEHREPGQVRQVRSAPLRPRARVLEGPLPTASPRQRVEVLTGAFSDRTPPQRLELSPAEAADRIVAQLVAWGEIPA
jgi:electron transfer flavoprotein beta subunit